MILRKWGFKQKVPRKVHVNTASNEEKECFKKEQDTGSKILDTLKKELTVVSTDESFFFYDSLIMKMWIRKDERPIVRITGSHHQESVLFGATSLQGKQLFRQYNWFDAQIFLDYLKQIHRKFPKCYLFLDKAKQHYRSKKVLKYFADNKDNLIPVYFPPTTSPAEFMVLEEIWYIAKNDLLVLQYYSSFTDFKNKISSYFRTKRFH